MIDFLNAVADGGRQVGSILMWSAVTIVAISYLLYILDMLDTFAKPHKTLALMEKRKRRPITWWMI